MSHKLTATIVAVGIVFAIAQCGGEGTPPDLPSSVQPEPEPTATKPGRTTPPTGPAVSRKCTGVRAKDGDTLVLACDKIGQVTVRVIGIDTPETKDPRKPVQCYGPQASSEAKRRVPPGQKSIRLISDPTQDSEDKYGRQLGYVTIYGRDFGRSMISGGFAREYTYRKSHPYQRQSEYRKAAAKAKALQVGLWGACAS